MGRQFKKSNLLWLAASLALAILVFMSNIQTPSYTDWKSYNGGDDSNHFSALSEINPNNVSQLKLAWSYTPGGADTLKNNTQIQCNPLIIKGVLYGVSASQQAFAINSATGKELWKTDLKDNTFNMTSRGLSFWTDGKEARIFFAFRAFFMHLIPKQESPFLLLVKREKLR